jgi:hypothetical protein
MTYYIVFIIIQAVSDAIGTGVVKKVPVEDMLLDPTFSKLEYDLLQVNLRLSSQQMRDLGFDLKYDVSDHFETLFFDRLSERFR